MLFIKFIKIVKIRNNDTANNYAVKGIHSRLLLNATNSPADNASIFIIDEQFILYKMRIDSITEDNMLH